ncbi:MAG: hypothetical protein E6H07_04935 [Bacteroidetes bacterium]|nr:MAG: hypothetical protein E6H07_04935 [Bacteroidota bacterium]
MKRITGLVLLFTLTHTSFAQNYRMTMGNEIRLKKGSTDLDIIYADNTGLYFTESRTVMKSYFLIGATYGENQKLLKFDKNYEEVFEKEYKKELKGFSFHSFQAMDGDIYMFVTDYDKKEKTFKVYGARVDKNSGSLIGDFAELGSYPLESKKDDFEMKMKPIRNGKNFLMVANVSGKEKVSLGISLLDKTLRVKEKTIIHLSQKIDEYSLQDVDYTTAGKIVLLGKEYELTQIGKKKRKQYVFKQYAMMIYSGKGEKESDIALNSGDRFVISGKMIEQNDGNLMLAGFYSNTSKKDDLNGFFINKVNPASGELTVSSFKEINSAMLGKNYENEAGDEDDDTKGARKAYQKAKDDDEIDEFPNEFVIRSVDINPADNSIVIASEISQYRHYSYTTSTYNSTTRTYQNTTEYVHTFTNDDILLINADKEGNIKWLNAIPKSQLEQVRTSSTNNSYTPSYFSYGYDYGSFFAEGGSMPYYSSFVSLINNNKLILVINDHSSNNTIPKYGDKVKRVFNFKKKSNVYGISVDLETGNMSKKFIAANGTDAILMPRQGYVIGNEFIIPSWRMHAMAKTELKFAKITVR